MRRSLSVALLVLAFFVVDASSAYAESVVWSQVQPDLMAPGANGPDRVTQFLYAPMVSITYNVSVSEVDAAGVKIRTLTSGSRVPVGAKILFEFNPHEYTDIYWFGTGGAWDSPYGAWIAGAGAPPYSERCTPKNEYAVFDSGKGSDGVVTLHAALSVAPPSKIASVNGASCVAQGNNELCTAQDTGVINANFQFAGTRGVFYPGFYSTRRLAIAPGNCSNASRSYGESTPMKLTAAAGQTSGRGSGGDFTLQVPSQTIPFSLNVGQVSGTAPRAPTLTPTPPLASGGACTVGTPHTITMSATDPDGDRVRYGVDWDANGTVDEYVPATGFVDSGVSQTASRTFATAGGKTVQARAEDELGNASGWSSLSFTCADAGGSGSDGNGASGNGNQSNASQDGSFNGTQNGENGSGNGNLGNNGRDADLQIRAIPSIVAKGKTTQIHWLATGAASCAVSASNGDAWTGLQSPIGGEKTSPIQKLTIYTLACRDTRGDLQTKRTTVFAVPVFSEI